MKKLSKASWIGILIGAIFVTLVGLGVNHFIKHINGTTDAQIESARRAKETAEQSAKALDEASQWHRDLMTEPTSESN